MARYIRVPFCKGSRKFMYSLLAQARIKYTSVPSSVTQGAAEYE
jgi:hypothetical protein